MSGRRLSSARAAAAALVLLAAALVAPASAAPKLPPQADPPTGKHIAGKFIWFDLMTSDPAAARKFYGAVFGWTFEPVKGTPEKYSVIRADGQVVGGVFKPLLPAGEKPRLGARWVSYASVASMDTAIAKLTAAGGSVLVKPTVVAGRGIHAILRDSQGAILGLLQSESGDRPDGPVGPGEFFWVDLFARDVAAAGKAYMDAGFKIDTSEAAGSRLLLVADGYARAGILRLPPEGKEPGWLPYVQVEDVAATVATVKRAGGKVLREPSPDVLQSRVAVIADPQGGVLGIIHWPVAVAAEKQP
jgi:predicted enzyme related to lactoylglutathione lyase